MPRSYLTLRGRLLSSYEGRDAVVRTTDIRTAETGVRELCVVPYAIADETPAPPEGRAKRIAHRWHTVTERLLPGSHPDVDDRIAALQERQSALDRRS